MIGRRSLLDGTSCRRRGPGAPRPWPGSHGVRTTRPEAPASSRDLARLLRRHRASGAMSTGTASMPGQTFNLMLSTGPGLDDRKGQDRDLSDRALCRRRPDIGLAQRAGAGRPAAGADHRGDGRCRLDGVDRADRHPALAVGLLHDRLCRHDRTACATSTSLSSSSPTRTASGDILLELSSNTWQAYNEWGGYSFYSSDFVGTNAQTISFDRPTAPDFFDYEYYLVLWLERFAAERGLKARLRHQFRPPSRSGLHSRTIACSSPAPITSTGRWRSSRPSTAGSSSSARTRSSSAPTRPTGRSAMPT